jgi:hypothetical protein
MRAGYDNLLFQPLLNQIRYLAEQRNFLADQRIQTAYQPNNNRIRTRSENKEEQPPQALIFAQKWHWAQISVGRQSACLFVLRVLLLRRRRSEPSL